MFSFPPYSVIFCGVAAIGVGLVHGCSIEAPGILGLTRCANACPIPNVIKSINEPRIIEPQSEMSKTFPFAPVGLSKLPSLAKRKTPFIELFTKNNSIKEVKRDVKHL
jgi:hypothetical protein